MMPHTMSAGDWDRLADAEFTHDADTARIEAGHLRAAEEEAAKAQVQARADAQGGTP